MIDRYPVVTGKFKEAVLKGKIKAEQDEDGLFLMCDIVADLTHYKDKSVLVIKQTWNDITVQEAVFEAFDDTNLNINVTDKVKVYLDIT